MSGRAYEFNDRVGCVVQRTNRKTGWRVGLYHAEQAGLDAAGGPWVTVCEQHGEMVNHDTLALARSHLADPRGWCWVCNREWLTKGLK